MCESYPENATRNPWKLKETQANGEVNYVHGLENALLFYFCTLAQCYPNQSSSTLFLIDKQILKGKKKSKELEQSK